MMIGKKYWCRLIPGDARSRMLTLFATLLLFIGSVIPAVQAENIEEKWYNEQLQNITDKVVGEMIFQEVDRTYLIGRHIVFGHYPQKIDSTEDSPIEWVVLDIRNNEALLLSLYGLDIQPYDKTHDYYHRSFMVFWETSTIRAWLNSDFFNRAFSDDEKCAVVLSDVDNSNAQHYYTTFFYTVYSANNTKDHVFLLSFREATEYLGDLTFKINENAGMLPTEYAYSREKYSNYGPEFPCNKVWWLRSPGQFIGTELTIGSGGIISGFRLGNAVDTYVRPAIWVDMSIFDISQSLITF